MWLMKQEKTTTNNILFYHLRRYGWANWNNFRDSVGPEIYDLQNYLKRCHYCIVIIILNLLSGSFVPINNKLSDTEINQIVQLPGQNKHDDCRELFRKMWWSETEKFSKNESKIFDQRKAYDYQEIKINNKKR